MARLRLVEDFTVLAHTPSFLKILALRLASQIGDGLFQAGLYALFFFRPETMTTPREVATALVVLMLPYCLVGPFVGPFLDRWRRRQVLWRGNLVRAAFVLAIMAVMAGVGVTGALYVLALVVLGLSRFMLAGLSAGMPRLLDSPERLLMANSLLPTMGGIATAIGAAIGVVLRLSLPAGQWQNLTSLTLAVVAYLAAAAIARTFHVDELGPDVRGDESSEAARLPLARQLRQVASELAEAVSYMRRRVRPGAALSVMSLHRFVYGVQMVAAILIARNLLAAPTDADSGLAAFGLLFAMLGLGYFLAIVLTPLAHEKITPSTWIVVCLLGGSVGQGLLALSPALGVQMAGLLIFAIGAQGAKIAVDTIVQRDTADEYRGRAFTVYDVLYNVSESAAALACVVMLPPTGFAPVIQVALIVFVWVVATAFAWIIRQIGDAPRPI